jgi:hypothetical protein
MREARGRDTSLSIRSRTYAQQVGEAAQRSTFRLTAASNEDLGQLVERGHFRRDPVHRAVQVWSEITSEMWVRLDSHHDSNTSVQPVPYRRMTQ